MGKIALIAAGLLIPVAGIALGARLHLRLPERIRAVARIAVPLLFLGLAVHLLLKPAMRLEEGFGNAPWPPVLFGFLAGVFLMYALAPFATRRFPHAIFYRSFPAGLSLGAVIAGRTAYPGYFSLPLVLVLFFAVAVLFAVKGHTRRAADFAVVSGGVMLLSAAAVMLAVFLASHIMPYVLSFSIGTSIYAAVSEKDGQSGGTP